MPIPGHTWRHVTISTRSSWLPGDPRGFRSRRHRIHSSGDYKQPPPTGEHAALHRFSRERSGDKVVIPPTCRPIIADALIGKIESLELRWRAIAVAPTHAHLLIELPTDLRDAKRIVGRFKQAASHAVRHELPGRIWASGGDFELVTTPAHFRNADRYILTRQGPEAVTRSAVQWLRAGRRG